MRRKDRGAMLVAPLTLFLLALLGLPLAVDIVYSLSRVSFQTMRRPELQGFANYAAVLGDPAFWSALGFSLRFALLTTALELALGLALALFLAPLLVRFPPLLAPLMLPMMVAPSLVGLMYRLVLNDFAGPLPYYLTEWTGDSPAFLAPRLVFATLVVIETLQWTPFALLILHTAHQAVPGELREAARIDGAGGWSVLRRIELPLMAPSIAVVALIRFTDGFRAFDTIYTLTGSGAGGSTTTVSIYIYQAFFRDTDIGRAVAASMLLLALSAVLVAAALPQARA
jgi:multiple sugar transport system permease protein